MTFSNSADFNLQISLLNVYENSRKNIIAWIEFQTQVGNAKHIKLNFWVFIIKN